MGSSEGAARIISHLAERQHGHVSRRQLLARGVSASAIAERVRNRRLIPVHAGVHAAGYRRVEPVARAAAAVLACGPGAVLSHDSAAALWGLGSWPRVPEITVPDDRRPRNIRVHRSRTLVAALTTTELGVRTTTAARTLADIRVRLPDDRFARLVNRARLDGHLSYDAADLLLAGRATSSPTRSGLEEGFLCWIAAHDLPRPLTNVVSPAGYEVDAWFPAHGVIIELDAFATHGDRTAFAGDRERDTAHLACRLITIRLIGERFTPEEAARLRGILTERRRRPQQPGSKR